MSCTRDVAVVGASENLVKNPLLAPFKITCIYTMSITDNIQILNCKLRNCLSI